MGQRGTPWCRHSERDAKDDDSLPAIRRPSRCWRGVRDRARRVWWFRLRLTFGCDGGEGRCHGRESLSNAVHNGTAPCNEYLGAASAELRAGTRTSKPPDQAQLVRFSQCMRANGVPSYPDPGTGGRTDFRGTGVDPSNPFVRRATKVCGRKIDAPSWWISGAGPPGDISVQSGPSAQRGRAGPSRVPPAAG